MERRARGSACQDSLFASQLSGACVGVLVRHREYLVEDRAVQDVRDEADADAWDTMAARRLSREQCGTRRFDGHDTDSRLALLESFAHPRYRPSRANGGHED